MKDKKSKQRKAVPYADLPGPLRYHVAGRFVWATVPRGFGQPPAVLQFKVKGGPEKSDAFKRPQLDTVARLMAHADTMLEELSRVAMLPGLPEGERGRIAKVVQDATGDDII